MKTREQIIDKFKQVLADYERYPSWYDIEHVDLVTDTLAWVLRDDDKELELLDH